MIRLISLSVWLFCTNLWAASDCIKDGISVQSVSLAVEGKEIDSWDPSNDIHRTRLPKGFDVGIHIVPATAEKYRELFNRTQWRGFDELAKITIYDMSTTPPKELSETWGGTNSKQGFGPRGGANGVPALVDQIELRLRKPVCITPESIAGVAK